MPCNLCGKGGCNDGHPALGMQQEKDGTRLVKDLVESVSMKVQWIPPRREVSEQNGKSMRRQTPEGVGSHPADAAVILRQWVITQG